MSYSDDMKELGEDVREFLRAHAKAHYKREYDSAEYKKDVKELLDRWERRGLQIYSALITKSEKGLALNVRVFNKKHGFIDSVEVKL